MANMTSSETQHAAAATATTLLDARSLLFLHESNAIEEITCFDYTKSEPGKLQGHVAAFLHSQQLARSRRPFSAVDLCWWQQLIVLEQRQARIEVPQRLCAVQCRRRRLRAAELCTRARADAGLDARSAHPPSRR
jgi:hypothetical protein